MCRSFTSGVNPCELVGADTAMNPYYTQTWMYMVTTTSLYTYTTPSDDDGMMDKPLSTEGSESVVNGGKTVIAVGSTHRSGSPGDARNGRGT